MAWEHAATAFQVSTSSLASLTQACRPLFGVSASVVGRVREGPTVRWAVTAARHAQESRPEQQEIGVDRVPKTAYQQTPLVMRLTRQHPFSFCANWPMNAQAVAGDRTSPHPR